MLLFFGSFIAGMLTVLAPCVLPLLPVIIGGSINGDVHDKKRPIIIAASLGISLFVFTLLLKVTTLFINVPPETFTYISGGILVGLGLLTLFPTLYAKLTASLGIEQRAQTTLNNSYKNKGRYIGPIIIGAALGPVFSSCSPVYAYILATVLPVSFVQAMLYIIAYIAGLVFVLLLVGYYGRRFLTKIRFASNPTGIFQRSIAVLFIVVGLLITTGYDKQFQTWVSTHTPFNFDGISASFLPSTTTKQAGGVYNVEPYAAPEFVGANEWINSKPLTMKSLKGKVVLIDFWTYSCINCIRNNPYLVNWYNSYKDKGLVVIGVHAPEFAFERNKTNVESAVKEQGIPYPVVLDNDFATWNAYQNRSWPASYLIDAEGNVRRVHEGEGEYDESEQAIRGLLEENGAKLAKKSIAGSPVPITNQQTPETYLGAARYSNFTNDKALASKPIQTFTAAKSLLTNYWTLSGTWEVQDQKIIAGDDASLKFHVAAKDVYLVMGSSQPANVLVSLNGKPISKSDAGSDVHDGVVNVREYKLYRLASFSKFSDSTIELSFPPGVELNAFTFGS